MALLAASVALLGSTGCDQRVTEAALRGTESFFLSLLDPANFLALLDGETSGEDS